MIDKFGRRQQPSEGFAIKRGLPGVGFKLTDDGNFDVERKRITNVNDPIDDNDVTNKKSVLIVDDSDVINVRKKRLINSADPVDDADVVNKKYARLAINATMRENLHKCLKISDDKGSNFDAKNKQIGNLGNPQEENDAANKLYVDKKIKNNCLRLNPAKTEYNAQERRISAVSKPVSGTDASNKDYVEGRLNDFNEAVRLLFQDESDDRTLVKNSIIEVIKAIQVLIKRSGDLQEFFKLKPNKDENIADLVDIYDALNANTNVKSLSLPPSLQTLTSKNENKNEQKTE